MASIFQLPQASAPDKEDSFIHQFKAHMLARQVQGGLRVALANFPAWQNALRQQHPASYDEANVQSLAEEHVRSWHQEGEGGESLTLLQQRWEAAHEAGEVTQAEHLWSSIENLQRTMDNATERVLQKLHLEKTDEFLASKGIDLVKARSFSAFRHTAVAVTRTHTHSAAYDVPSLPFLLSHRRDWGGSRAQAERAYIESLI